VLHCVSEKGLCGILAITLPNLNRFSRFFHLGKRMKFPTEHI